MLRRGTQPKDSKFEARMWLGPYKVKIVRHQSHELETAPGRRSRKPVYVRRLRLYIQRENGEPKIANKPIPSYIAYYRFALHQKSGFVQ